MSNKNLNLKTKKGIIWDLSGSLVRQFAMLFLSIILARLLTPEEFGIIAMPMVFISISHAFTDVGFTAGLIQQNNSKDIAYSSVFYVNLAISIVLSLAIILAAPGIANFYDQPEITHILLLLSIIPPVAALGRVHAAILIKQIDFKSLTIRDLVATIIGGTSGVIAAYLDYGVYSLVIQQITMTITATIMLWFSSKWKPKLEFSSFEIKQLFSFSGFVFLDNLMRQTFNKIDIIFIGKVFSPAILGFYTRAESFKSQVQSYTTSSFNKVMFPVLSQLQDDEGSFRSTYLRAFNIITGLIILIIAPLFFLAHFIITLLIGDKWEPSVILFQYLVLSLLTGPQVGMMGKAILAKGFSKLRFNIGLIQRLIKLTPIALGFYYGIEEFAMGMVFASFLILILYLIVMDLKLGIGFWAQFKNFIIPNAIFFIFIISYFLFKNLINPWFIASLFFCIHIIYIKLLNHESYIFIFKMMSNVFNRKKSDDNQ